MRSTFISYLLVTLIFSTTAISHPEERYSKIRIQSPTPGAIRELSTLGIALDDYGRQRGIYLDIIVGQEQLRSLRAHNIPYDVLIDDMYRYYDGQTRPSKYEQTQILDASSVKGFGFGSMGGYYTYEEVGAQLDSMNVRYPDLIAPKVSLEKSIEGRDIWMIRLSNRSDMNDRGSEVLYTAMHHAREPEGMMALLYFMYYLLEQYGKDAEVTYLLEHRDLYFVPVVNPDGYAYNEKTRPSGGGLWRKSRRLNEDSSNGIDLNRNYGYQWGYDDIGSSPVPRSDTYRGSAPFSEPEIRAIRDFCFQHHFLAALNYHAYGNDLIYPFGYTDKETPDSSVFRIYARDMTKFNGYTYGLSTETVHYPTNGDSDDWMYGEQTSKNKIISMTPELGQSADGFWPAMNRILPLAKENLKPNLYLAWAAGPWLCIEATDSRMTSQRDTAKVTVKLRNLGLKPTGSVTIVLSTTDSSVTVFPQQVNITSIPSFSMWSNTDTPLLVSLSKAFPYYGQKLSCTLHVRYDDTEIDSTFNLDPKPVQVDGSFTLLSQGNFRLCQNYPNPFNPNTTITYQISDFGFVLLKIYDILGREVATLVNGDKPAGSHEVNFSASNLSSGIYYYRLSANGFTETKRMVISK
jgi:hypothetical protein